jgi:adenosylcobinamide-phosphate synthase
MVADAALGDPRRWHPVAGFGSVAAVLERRCYSDRRVTGTLHTAVLVAAATGLGALAERAVAGRPLASVALTGAATWAVLGGTSLSRHGAALAAELTDGDLVAARARLPSLCGRDPAALDADGMTRAGTESMAENTSDAVVAPLLWGAVAGVPGLLGYRAVNTLDAMVGHRSPRYARFGWAAARLDDVVNLVPARVTALLAATQHPRPALRAWRRDAPHHPSPNAGAVEAAFAGALGVRLGGVNRYGDDVQDRGFLGDGRPPEPRDIGRATRLANRVGLMAMTLAVLAAIAWRRPGR